MRVIGIMSGTSLDGLDIASCYFPEGDPAKFRIEAAVTVDYPEEFSAALKGIMKGTAEDLVQLDFSLGYFIGEKVRDFIRKENLKPDLIASHGHTVFHQPERNFTCQIGNGSCIAAKSGYPVVYDFRSMDVALGGQGAPLVPIGDRMLFGDYTFCLNLGGIANISYTVQGKTYAFDISPANMALNSLAEEKGRAFDDGGKMAERGKVDQGLLARLNSLDFYSKPYPKSLGKEWFDKDLYPLIKDTTISPEDRLRTVCQHIAEQIAAVVKSARPSGEKSGLLATGGGAFNNFLIATIRREIGAETELVVPDELIVKFKEALIFAWLGYLRIKNKVNVLASVTGSCNDNTGGALVSPGIKFPSF